MAIVRHLWALPYTLVGLAVAGLAMLGGATISTREGVVEVYGGPLAQLSRIPLPGGIGALTIGHVVLATNGRQMGWSRVHERAHVRQYETWGPFFVPAYLVASLVTGLRGGATYVDNRFEREAREAEALARARSG
jgi:hypothetical protein